MKEISRREFVKGLIITSAALVIPPTLIPKLLEAKPVKKFGEVALQSNIDDLNTRQIIALIRRNISKACEEIIFEPNDEITRSCVSEMTSHYLDALYERKVITNFKVECDERNNPVDVIDKDQLVLDVFVQPKRSIEYCHLKFAAQRSGINFKGVEFNG